MDEELVTDAKVIVVIVPVVEVLVTTVSFVLVVPVPVGGLFACS